MDLSNIDFKKLSLGQSLNLITKHKLYELSTKFIVIYLDSSTKEWIPFGLYDNYVIAEHFEKIVKHDFRNTCILPVDHYVMPIKV